MTERNLFRGELTVDEPNLLPSQESRGRGEELWL